MGVDRRAPGTCRYSQAIQTRGLLSTLAEAAHTSPTHSTGRHRVGFGPQNEMPHRMGAAFQSVLDSRLRTGSASPGPSSFSSCLRTRRSGRSSVPSSACRLAVVGACGAAPGLMSLTWSGAAAGASAAGSTVFTGPTGFTTAFGSAAAASPAGALTTETPTPVPPSGAVIDRRGEGTSVRGGSFTPVGVTACRRRRRAALR